MWSRSCELTGDVFFQAPEEDVRAWAIQRWRRRGMFCSPSGPVMNMELLRCLLAPGQVQRMDSYMMQRDEQMALDGSFLFDVMQNVHGRVSKAGPMFPCQLTHGEIISANLERAALGCEHLSANGFQIYNPRRPEYLFPLSSKMRAMNDEHVKHMSGNGRCLPVILAWVLYCFSHTVRLEDVVVPVPNPIVAEADKDEARRCLQFEWDRIH